MTVFAKIIIANLIISAGSLIGVLTLSLKHKVLDKIIMLLVAFSAGTLMGGAFLHLIPEAAESLEVSLVMSLTVFSFITFYLIEKVFHWRHCHEDNCDVHAFGMLNLIGDGIHNFIDGLVIAGSFVLDPNLGIVTAFAVAAHEIPQELGDFGVLLHAGFSKTKALIANVGVALTSVMGGIVGYFLASYNERMSIYLLPIAAGGFLYISASDLLPELRKENRVTKSLLTFGLYLLGIGFMLMVD